MILSKSQALARVIQAKRICRKTNGFEWFVKNIFSCSFPNGFITGKYIFDVIETLEKYKWTMDISGRDHFKSTRLYAEIMFEIFVTDYDIEGHYFSYSNGLSAYHLEKVKQMIRCNKWFVFMQDLSPTSQSVLHYYNGEARILWRPSGLLNFKRGIHAERIYIDDPLKDPENKLAPTVIYKINNIIKTELMAMVKKGGKCRIVGTPQTNSDFFFDEGLSKRFKINIKPAIVDDVNKISIFPEWKTWEELNEIRSAIGDKAFNQEYMAKPAYSEDSYITRNELQNVINKNLQQAINYKGNNDIVAGFDIGKKTHPAHLSIFERTRNEKGEYHYKQLLSKWFDNIDYKEQLDYLLFAIDNYSIDILRYDNTRGEFEGFQEQGLLHDCMVPVVFNMKSNNAMAVSLHTAIIENRVELINDIRQSDQLLQVNNDLKAIETVLGHGDSFWSNALALWEERSVIYAGVR